MMSDTMTPRNLAAKPSLPRRLTLGVAGTVVVAALGAAPLSGCVYRVNIQQGNFLEQKTVDQVAVGMTRAQVRFLLGTPQVADPFNHDRWDYLYLFHDGKKRTTERRQFVVLFQDDKVASVERPTGAMPNDAPRAPVNGA
jgi:outer membrane protein assembly factor BamE